MSHIILPGEIKSAIGAEGMSEALQRRWLVPDTDTGYLNVTRDMQVVAEMQKIAEMKPETCTLNPVPISESHDMALGHTRRRSIVEIAAPGTGAPAPGLTSVSQPTPPTQPTQPGQPATAAGDHQIGTAVTTARDGRTYSGVIEKLLPNGRFQVGFPAGQPKPNGDSSFGKDEMTIVPSTPQR